MNEPKSHSGNTRRELRKALIRLRMEMHRQEIRHETAHLLQPLQRMRGLKNDALGIKHAPLWGVGAVALMGFFSGRGARNRQASTIGRLVKLGVTLLPLLKVALQNRTDKR